MANIYFQGAVDDEPAGTTSMWRALVLVPWRTPQTDQTLWASASNPAADSGWLVEYLASGSFRFRIADGTPAEQSVSLAVALVVGHPVVVVATFNGTTLGLYTPAASNTAAAAGYTAASGLTPRVGATPDGQRPADAFTVAALLASETEALSGAAATALAAELEALLAAGGSLLDVTSASPDHVWEASDFSNTTWTDSVGALDLTEVGEVQAFSFPSE